jgi:hypothetical protein
MLLRLIQSLFGSSDAVVGHSGGNVYVCLMGGLGNQLFQYAFARFLAQQGVPVRGLVTNLYDGDKYLRKPLVQAVSRVPVAALSRDEIANLRVHIDEDGMAIRDALRRGESISTLCRGYWQKPEYAAAVAAELAADLTAFGERAHRAEALECVLHVRRHDYGHHGLLPLAYYRAALEQCGWPPFKVVTDEPNFCAYAFASIRGFAGVTRGDTSDPWRDFFLLAKARRQIIANSSFSWWTAWLGRAAGTTTSVIAPSEWSLVMNADPCPTDWQRLDVPLLRP